MTYLRYTIKTFWRTPRAAGHRYATMCHGIGCARKVCSCLQWLRFLATRDIAVLGNCRKYKHMINTSWYISPTVRVYPVLSGLQTYWNAFSRRKTFEFQIKYHLDIVTLWWSDSEYVSIGPGNNLAPNRRQVIKIITDCPINRSIYAPPGLRMIICTEMLPSCHQYSYEKALLIKLHLITCSHRSLASRQLVSPCHNGLCKGQWNRDTELIRDNLSYVLTPTPSLLLLW